ncbi:MAG: tyrosine--tRNA ligase [Candidatus Omnitrophica bacterium]|nr:tyrosine--tRNA ligase [Candidatus Omnitrophota bacterium]
MDIQEAIRIISRGTTEIINAGLLEKKLAQSAEKGIPLVVKAGFDPTAPDIHLGHVVLLRKMRQFQQLGHRVVFLIGDFTAQVGDPTGRNELRKKMTREDIERNAVTYKDQVFKVLDPHKTEVVFNSHWFGSFSAQQLMELTAHATVAQTLARADFKKRFDEGREISLLEFIYPLLQGYDSVHLKADVELGGSDQKFNLLMGRQIQEAFNQPPQVVIMTPLLEGLDGVQKMSKSLGNYIGINEPPREIFGKVMSLSDVLMIRYFELLTDEDIAVIRQMHPKEAKMKLAGNIVSQFHGTDAARDAHMHFESVFAQKQVPDDVQVYVLAQEGVLPLADILVKTKMASSKNEARRLIKQAAVTFEGQPVADEGWVPAPGVLKVGKRRFLKFE